MKPFSLVVFASLTLSVQAQFHEPRTVAEDPVQRLFPIEAARVLAWVRGFGGEVAWSLEQSGPGGSTWKIAWKDADGTIVRQRTVQTGAPRMAQGPAYYRGVFREIAGDDWAIPSAPPDNAASAFWQGADLAGPQRRDALASIAKLQGGEPGNGRAADAARLAGALVHAATGSIARKGAIDAVLLARGAAWLAIAELRLREPIEIAWAPILFLAGRELEASELWQSPEARTKLRSGAEKFWNMALAEPRVGDAFAFAAGAAHRTWALPAMYLFIRRDFRLQIPAAELATGTVDYPLLTLERASGVEDVTDLAAQFPAASAFAPVAAATKEEIAAGFPGPPVEAGRNSKPDPEPGRLSEISDEEIAQLAGKARAAAAAVRSPGAAGSRPAPDFTDAEKAWAFVRSLDQPPANPDSPEDRMRRVRLWLGERRAAAERFRASFPQDPRRWDALIIEFETAQQLIGLGDSAAKPLPVEALDGLLAAPDAGAESRGDAAFHKALQLGSTAAPSHPHTLPPFQRALVEFIDAHPGHRRVREAASILFQILGAIETPGANNFLQRLAAHSDAQIATQARAMIDLRARTAELKKNPLDLKFIAADGREVDAGKLRGKVVLLDFWASWCAPCMAEAPHVVATYEKFRARGFEIIGINLDQDRAAMDAAAVRSKMTWPQHHDGKGWKNEIAQRFGIHSIPATWLFDKKGRLREIGLRGRDMEARVENLLGE